jgi:hypothetical protein
MRAELARRLPDAHQPALPGGRSAGKLRAPIPFNVQTSSMRYPLASAALLLSLAACGGDDFDAGAYDVTGRWTGAALADTARYELDLDLRQEAEDISGTGTLTAGGETVDVRVTGEFAFPSVDLVLSAPGFVPAVFDAAFEVDTIRRAEGTTPAVTRESPFRIGGTLRESELRSLPLTILRDTL